MIFRWKNGVNMALVLLAGMVMGLSGCACPEKPGPMNTDRPGAGTEVRVDHLFGWQKTQVFPVTWGRTTLWPKDGEVTGEEIFRGQDRSRGYSSPAI